MKISLSLWSADLLDLGTALDRFGGRVDAFHLDVMDGNCVPTLLFGTDFVRAIRARTRAAIDVHAMLTKSDEWISRLVEAGADMVTVHRHLCRDVNAALAAIRKAGAKAGLVVGLGDEVSVSRLPLHLLDRVLLMGTELGVKGCDIDPTIYDRIRQLVSMRRGAGQSFEIFVDGGIRRHTVPGLAAAGADGVVPGSLVFGAPDPMAAIEEIKAMKPLREAGT